MGVTAVHSPLSRSCTQTAQGNSFLTSKAEILGDRLHHAGETSTFQPQAPLMGASSFSLHPHVHPSGLSAEWLQWSCLSTVHHIRQCIRTPRCLHPLLSLCSHSEASCKLLTSYSGKHGATDGLEVQSSLSSLLVEGGQPVYFDSDSSLLGGWLQKHQHTAGQIKDGFSVTLVWTFLATTV